MNFDHPCFGGRDLRVMRDDGGTLHQCRTCELIFATATPARKAAIAAVFADNAYATAQLPRHRVVGQADGKSNRREALQARLFTARLAGEAPSILDIGCFDGALLREMAALYPKAHLHGYDVNEGFRALFGETENRTYHAGALDHVQGPFNLIVLSHSVQYIDDIAWLKAQLDRLLAPDGVIIVQVPDCARSVYSLFLGDKYYHYTRAAICNVLATMGLRTEVLPSDTFPRDVVVVAGRGNAYAEMRKTGFVLTEALARVDATCDEIRRLKAAGRICVLGTTIASTFVGTALGASLGAFADENPEKAGTQHAGHPVVHPHELADDDVLIVPFGKTADAIIERFKTLYKGRHIAA